ncbi:MAG: fluoride efflux transporter CrcB [Alphaproteobacteria bacterium]
MIGTIGVVALGGAMGATARHGVNITAAHWLGQGYPWGTMIVNILGSFLMGIILGKILHMEPVSPEVRAFLTTGFLGAFTTFSAFSQDIVTLYERGAVMQAMAYLFTSVLLGIVALAIGVWIMRSMAS